MAETNNNSGQTAAAIANIAVTLINTVSFKSIRDKAKAKKALEIAKAGGYNTLTAYQKSLLSFNGYSYYETPENAGNIITGDSLLTFILIVGGIIYFFYRKK